LTTNPANDAKPTLMDRSPDLANQPESLPEATDPLVAFYGHPGPYVSVYLAIVSDPDDTALSLAQRWPKIRETLESNGAKTLSLDAVEVAVLAPPPEDVAAVAVLAAADGAMVTEYGLEPPKHDYFVVDVLPHAGPLLEWRQRRVPHLVVVADEKGIDIAAFGTKQFTQVVTHSGSLDALTQPIVAAATLLSAKLIILSGPSSITRRMAYDLHQQAPIDCRIVAEQEAEDVGELADAVVRHVSDASARTTVGFLRELRFMASHGAAVDGTEDTVAALRSGEADVLLIHDDPSDQRKVWIGPAGNELSLAPRDDLSSQARLVDAAIRAAVTGGGRVHIIPTTGHRGPDDNTAALTSRP